MSETVFPKAVTVKSFRTIGHLRQKLLSFSVPWDIPLILTELVVAT
jgi:hypothetical protein